MNPVIEANKREVRSKSSIKNIRRNGNVPAMLCARSNHPSPQNIAVDGKSLAAFMRQLKPGYLPTTKISLNLKDIKETLDVIVNEISYHRVTGEIIHLTFKPLEKGQSVNVIVPIRVTGLDECVGIKAGGALVMIMNHVPVRAKVEEIPYEVVADIAGLNIKQSIRVSELAGLEKVQVLCNARHSFAKIAKMKA